MKLLKFVTWSAAHVAWLTMSISPLAVGAEANRISKQNLQQYMQEAGLNRSTTFGQLWEKTKPYYPGYLYKQMETLSLQNKNVEVPQMSLSSATGTDGVEIPVLTFSVNGKNHTLQFYGDKNKWVKFDNVNLSVEDLKRPDDVLKRMTANDINVKKEVDAISKKSQVASNENYQIQKQYTKDFSRFKGFPRVTPKMWKTMSAQDRAAFIVNMRLMWRSARKVIGTANGEIPKTAYEPTFIEKLFKTTFNDATAQDAAIDEMKTPPPKNANALDKASKAAKIVADKRKGTNPFSGDCIVAGYVGKYVDKVTNYHGDVAGCSVESAISTYNSKPGLKFVVDATQECQKNYGASAVACNPIIYGYPGGQARCADKSKQSFQKATWFEGPCENGNHLSSSKDVVPFKEDEKDYTNITPRPKQLDLIEADQKKVNFQATQDFLNGYLKHSKLSSFDDIMSGKAKWTLEIDDALVDIQNQFESEIETAIGLCEKDIVKVGKANEAKQKGACDQLHRRWLFTERFIAKVRATACDPDSKYIGAYDDDESSRGKGEETVKKSGINKAKLTDMDKNPLCECTETKTMVGFGESCNKMTQVFVPGKKLNCTGPFDNDKNKKPADCAVIEHPNSCPAGTTLLAGGDNDECICNADKEKRVLLTTDPKDVPGLCEKRNWWPLAGLAALAAAGFFLWRHNTKDPKPPIVPMVCPATQKLVGGSCICKATCPVGTGQNGQCGCDTNPPAQKCTPPRDVGTYPACSCAPKECTPGQTIWDQQSCQCTNVPEKPKCADGSYVPVSGVCPVIVVPPATEGGKDTNPTDSGGYGGVPTGK